ncbi:hypothetical protein HW555_012062 [Spodoptera exigua]|uniref:Uncharacterized protein n=1 Tax=Spodoptera exigua TaxID=7107 RepID=A0A835L126_SPOEX|nr:hypothetical protein HW555_012062 [Spodoptera exigua]
MRMALKLFKMDASPPVRAVYMVIEALKLPEVKYVETDLLNDDHLKDDFLKINPQHTIPHLTDGDFQLSDSHAIITYLINKYGNNSDLYPNDPQKRAMIDQKLHFDSGILYPALRENDEPIFFGTATSLKPGGVAKIKSAYDFTEKFLTGSKWLAGNKLTLADISCVATISTLNELLPIDEVTYPNICAWLNRCEEYEFYKKGNQPGLLEFRRLLKMYLALRSVFMAIEALELENVQMVDVNLFKGEHLREEYLKVNPQHTVPMLADNDFYIWDSGILFPSLRGTVEPVLFWGETSFRPENLAKIKKAYEFMEKFLTNSKPWLTGDEVTLADICCVSTLSSMHVVLPIDAEDYPNLASWMKLCALQQFYVAGNIPGLEQFERLVKQKLDT